MGGEVIIITQDPDARTPDTPPEPTPKVQLANVSILFSDFAHPSEVANAVNQVLTLAQQVRGG